MSRILSNDYPFGPCSCTSCYNCNGHPGPAAYEVVREGQTVRVCTRCIFSWDRKANCKILPTAETTMKPFADWDPLGLYVLVSEIMASEAESAAAKAHTDEEV